MSTKTRSKHQKDLYATYKNSEKWKTNRKKKLLRDLKRSPGNEAQIAKALDNISYRRRIAKEPNKTVPNDRRQRVEYEKISEKAMFKLKMRAHDREGNLLWNS